MIYTILCNNRLRIVIDFDGDITSDKSSFVCPKSCPKYDSCPHNGISKIFAKSVIASSSPLASYSFINGVWQDKENPTEEVAPTEVKEQPKVKSSEPSYKVDLDAVEEKFKHTSPAPQPVEQPKVEESKSIEQPKQAGGFNSDDFMARFKKSEPKQETKSTIKTDKTFENITYNGKTYSKNTSLIMSGKNDTYKNLLRQLYLHWQVDFIFDNDKLSDQFIFLLKELKVIPNDEIETRLNELMSLTLSSSHTENLNLKFFYVMHIVAPKLTQEEGFIYSKEISPFTTIKPIFISKDEFIRKLFDSDEVGKTFRKNLLFLFPLALYHFGYFKGYNNEFSFVENFASYKNRFIVRNFELSDNIVMINFVNDHLELYPLGSFDEFVNNMFTLSSLRNQEMMISFLKEYHLVINNNQKQILPREEPISELTQQFEFEGELIYRFLKIKDTSLSLSEFNCFMSLLNEYIRSFSLSKLNVNNVLELSKANFIKEAHDIVLNGCKAALSKGMVDKDDCIAKALLLYSLSLRGILDEYIKLNEAKFTFGKYLTLLEKISNNSITIEDYKNVFENETEVHLDGEDVNIEEYLTIYIKKHTLGEINHAINNDDILKMLVKISDDISSQVNSAISSYQKMFSQMF